MGSIVFAQAMRPPEMSFIVTASTSEPLIFSRTRTAFWESLPCLQITYTAAGKRQKTQRQILNMEETTLKIKQQQKNNN